MNDTPIWTKIWEISKDIHDIKADGCAHRKDDLKRVENVEKNVEAMKKKLDAIYLLILANLVVLVGNLISKLLPIIEKPFQH